MRKCGFHLNPLPLPQHPATGIEVSQTDRAAVGAAHLVLLAMPQMGLHLQAGQAAKLVVPCRDALEVLDQGGA